MIFERQKKKNMNSQGGASGPGQVLLRGEVMSAG